MQDIGNKNSYNVQDLSQVEKTFKDLTEKNKDFFDSFKKENA